jgi:hypothetical protein
MTKPILLLQALPWTCFHASGAHSEGSQD